MCFTIQVMAQKSLAGFGRHVFERGANLFQGLKGGDNLLGDEG